MCILRIFCRSEIISKYSEGQNQQKNDDYKNPVIAMVKISDKHCDARGRNRTYLDLEP